MKYLATLLLAFMTIALVISGILLWKRRNETGDYSRHIQAVSSWISSLFTSMFIIRTWQETTTVYSAFFEPEHTFVPLLMQMSFFLYPLEVIRPSISRSKVHALLFTPLLLLAAVGLVAGIEYTPIYSYSDLWQNIGKFNVWFRLLSLVVMLFYCFSLFLVPYDWHKSSADKKFIMHYSCGFCLIGLLYFAIQITHLQWLVIAHQVAWISVFLSVAWYELNERLLVPQTNLEPEDSCNCNTAGDKLWEQISFYLESNEKWRDPDLNMTSLSELLESNRTYVGEAFKRNTGMTFIEYITKRRINHVTQTLENNPNTNIQELFNFVGYRQRSTAWRNFQKITGKTPAEFLENLK